MILEIIGQLWLIMAALTAYYSMRATYRDWGYNKPTPQPKEKTCRNESRTRRSRRSKPRGVLKERNTLRTGETWSHGEVDLTRSELTAKKSKIRMHAAANGSRE